MGGTEARVGPQRGGDYEHSRHRIGTPENPVRRTYGRQVLLDSLSYQVALFSGYPMMEVSPQMDALYKKALWAAAHLKSPKDINNVKKVKVLERGAEESEWEIVEIQHGRHDVLMKPKEFVIYPKLTVSGGHQG